MDNRKLKVLIVDDSALVRRILTELLSADPEVEVVGAASDAYMARDKIKALNPDVITLDVEMPKMDGLTFLRNLMRLRPMPVVMVSSLTERGADATLAALQLGAIDFIPKPKIDIQEGLEELAAVLVDKVKAASTARPAARTEEASARAGEARAARTITDLGPTDRLIGIGSSTGGTEAVAQILAALPADAPGVVIAQHIPEVFS